MNRTNGLFLTGLSITLLFGGMHSRLAYGQQLDLSAFRNSALAKHNTYRSTHHSPNLTLDNSLNSGSQAHAESLLSTGQMVHSSDSKNYHLGENLFYFQGPTVDAATVANKAVDAWYQEAANYDYNNPGFTLETGHFTQVVWKSTTAIGCGVASGPSGYPGMFKYYVVCQFAPAGNVYGAYPGNVLKP